ncbi:hypothetical protein GGF31_005953 [Allomyces arbusculus]|nr:hypothetical protein GGF31_005953 [Allomyces arbusculus]
MALDQARFAIHEWEHGSKKGVRIAIVPDGDDMTRMPKPVKTEKIAPYQPGWIDPTTTTFFDVPRALNAVLAGSHVMTAIFEMTGSGDNRKPSGSMAIHCLPSSAAPWRRPAADAQALVQVQKRPGRDGTAVTISALARANLLADQVTYVNQQRAITEAEKVAKKYKKRRVASPDLPLSSLPPGVLTNCVPPTLPPDVAPLVVTVPHLPAFSRINVVVTIRGHRILITETAGWFNKHLEWEARLLYPNYPLDQAAATRASSPPIEGTHYTLLMRHYELQPCCACCCPAACCECFGGGGDNSRLVIKLALVRALESAVAPGLVANGPAATAAANTATATGDEIALTLIAIAPAVNLVIVQRKAWVIIIPCALLTLAGVIVQLVFKFIVNK